MGSGESSIAKIKALANAGIKIAMDDFGTGYSSLSQLKKLPIDKLKIDRSFVMNLEQDEKDQALVKTVITLGKNLGMSVVAEGVENRQQQDILLQFGCDLIQGFYRQRPVSVSEIERLLESI